MKEAEASPSAGWLNRLLAQPLLLTVAVVVFCILFFLIGLLVVIALGGTDSLTNVSPTSTLAVGFVTPTSAVTQAPGPPPLEAVPSIALLSVQGEAGTLVTVTGRQWQPGETVLIRIDDPTGLQALEPLVSETSVAGNGTLITSFLLPADSRWSNLTAVQVTASSTTSAQQVSAEFIIIDSPFNPPPPAPATLSPSLPPPNDDEIVPPPTIEFIPSTGDWASEYYDNPALVGIPAVVRNDVGIDFNWGFGAPYAALPPDGFSVRWGRLDDFEPGVYRFHVLADDGVRLWLNNGLVIDEWYSSSYREISVEYPLEAGGVAEIRLEYTDFSAEASIQFWWERVGDIGPPPPAGPPYYYWQGAYWPNVNLFGTPLIVREDPSVNFDWGNGLPALGFPNDNFSARWDRLVDFVPATYRFYLTVDDGGRVWVDGRLIIDEWRDGPLREVTADITLAGGPHEVRVEYYERVGNAAVQLRWDKSGVTPTPVGSYPDWQADYWSNSNLSGSSTLTRNDPVINFSWGSGSPDPRLPVDNFSARWSRSYNFGNGLYRFTAVSDDGVRFFLDGALVLNEWYDTNTPRTHTVDLNLNGSHWLVVEYYERIGNAQISFSWQQLNPTATPVSSDPAALIPITAARFDLSGRTGVPVPLIKVVSVAPAVWRDSNLECPGRGAGTAVITPGFLIILEADGRLYEYHTDENINAILCIGSATPAPTNTAVPTPFPTPIIFPTSTSLATLTPIPTPSDIPTATVVPVGTLTPTPVIIGSPSPDPLPTLTPTATIISVGTLTPTPLITGTLTPSPEATDAGGSNQELPTELPSD